MARYKVILAYDGTGFKGSQRQENVRTVQSELEKALTQVGWPGPSVLLAGRTDTGVHAIGQVASFDLEWQHTEEELLNALNYNFPKDLAAWEVQKIASNFHPRFDAISRRYRYHLFCQEIRDPIREKFAWRIWPDLDHEILFEVAKLFIGKYDFAAYGSPPRAESNTVRTIMETDWQNKGDEWQFEVKADAFMYRMVRRLVFIQVAAGHGKVSVATIAHSLVDQAEGQDGTKFPSGLAPAHGLSLVEVTYSTK
ncbi:MAG: tRNA pseudouridine(38-40) synthase TruA [Anaerolineae bacterium]|nr:tRNA pseudouridine(38-40) synthase TruA [Anaerolineae bacterium]MDK1118625.1 tRNA pseudouridine(38-40) synthase TruA [Anaerolineae bacterium]